MGIVGFGRIGTAVAKKAHFGFDMRILAHSRSLRQAEAPNYVTACNLNTLLERSDVVSLHLPGCTDNENLFGAETFS